MNLQSLPKTPSGYHAFLLADIFVDDPGSGAYVDVIFRDGSRIRARASPDVLRLGDRLRGHHRGTMHFRTSSEGKLIEPIHLYKVRVAEEPLPHASGTYWSAVGSITEAGDVLRVYPERARAEPFQISYIDKSLSKNSFTESIHVLGWLQNLHLVALEINSVAPLKIPDRWLKWRW